MSDTIIRIENLGKKYQIRHQQPEKYVALRDVISQYTDSEVNHEVYQPDGAVSRLASKLSGSLSHKYRELVGNDQYRVTISLQTAFRAIALKTSQAKLL